MNFYDLLKKQADILGDKIFLQTDDQIFSYKNFLKAVDNSELGGKFFSQAVKIFSAQKFNRSNVFEVATSGSTSNPKKLSRTYESWADFFPTQNKIFRINGNSKLFMHGNLNFTGNLNAFLSILFAGGTVITSDKFSPHIWLNHIKNSTNIYLVPTKLTLLTKGEPIKNICSIFSGSQVLTENQSLSLMKKFPDAEIFLYYGASEFNYITYKKITSDNVADVQNLGKTFDGVKIFIRDDFIYVDTPYHVEEIGNPATIGDMGRIENGDLIFLGRGEDFINRGGVKIFASEIENRICAISGVKSAAVVKIKDKLRGENFVAYVVGNITAKNIRQTLLPAESPKEIIFMKELPLNSSGKIDKKFLAAQYLDK